MCLLTYFPPQALADVDALANGAITNDDGHGYAIVTRDNQLLVERGMDSDEMIDRFANDRKAYPDGPAMFHSRFGTAGKRNLANVHPFNVARDPRTVLAHNGVFDSVVQPAKGDKRSDTRIVADDLFNRARDLVSRRTRKNFEKWMTSYNKVVILTVDPKFRNSAFILNEKSGIWSDGVWYSNDGYLPPKFSGKSYYSSDWEAFGYGASHNDPDGLWKGWKRDKSDDWTLACKACHWINDDLKLDYCEQCAMCFDCENWPEDCDCYIPASLKFDMEQRALEADAKAIVVGHNAEYANR